MRSLVPVLQLLELLIFIRVLMTWFVNPFDPRFKIFTDPIDRILRPFRVVIQVGGTAADIGPLLALLLLQVLQRVIWYM